MTKLWMLVLLPIVACGGTVECDELAPALTITSSSTACGDGEPTTVPTEPACIGLVPTIVYPVSLDPDWADYSLACNGNEYDWPDCGAWVGWMQRRCEGGRLYQVCQPFG